MRAVLDTTVLVSTILQPAGIPAQVLLAWQQGWYDLVISPAILDELRNTLSYPRLRRKYPYTDDQVERFVHLLAEQGTIVPGTTEVSEPNLRDPDDSIILACAAEGDVDAVVTGDRDLLVLGSFGRTRLVTPREFRDHYLPSSSR